MEPCFGGKLPEDLDHRCPKTGVPPKCRQTDDNNNRQTDRVPLASGLSRIISAPRLASLGASRKKVDFL